MDKKEPTTSQVCSCCGAAIDTEISKISWTDFVSGLDEEHYSELITYLKERRL